MDLHIANLCALSIRKFESSMTFLKPILRQISAAILLAIILLVLSYNFRVGSWQVVMIAKNDSYKIFPIFSSFISLGSCRDPQIYRRQKYKKR